MHRPVGDDGISREDLCAIERDNTINYRDSQIPACKCRVDISILKQRCVGGKVNEDVLLQEVLELGVGGCIGIEVREGAVIWSQDSDGPGFGVELGKEASALSKKKELVDS